MRGLNSQLKHCYLFFFKHDNYCEFLRHQNDQVKEHHILALIDKYQSLMKLNEMS